MRIAIVADIHGNAVALDAVLSDLDREGIDRVVCLGDVAADGPQPREVLARLRERDIPVVMGNMDAWLLAPAPHEATSEKAERIAGIQRWGAAQLEPQDFDDLRAFVPTLTVPLDAETELLCYHGSPRSNTEPIDSVTPAAALEEMLAGRTAAVLAGGHTHVQMIRRLGRRTLLNPGSVGAPRVQPDEQDHRTRAEYGVVHWDAAGARLQLRRVVVDAEALAASARDSGMPHAAWWMALRYGVS